MRIINKLFKKKHILLTLMFTNYGMNGPNQVNTQNINTENLLALQVNTQNINTENLLALYNIKKQEFYKFFQTIQIIAAKIETIFNFIIIIYSIDVKQNFENIVKNNSFLYKNIRSFIEKEINNYDPKNYKLNILYQELIPEHDNKIIFTPFLEIDNKTLEKNKKTQKNFIRNIITNCNTLLEFFNEYNLQKKINDLNIQINEYISTMEKYLFFITMEKYLFATPSNLLRESFLSNLNTLYQNPDIKIKDNSNLKEEEKFVLQQFQELIRLRNEINKREYKKIIKSPKAVEISSEIPSIIEEMHNNNNEDNNFIFIKLISIK